MKLNLGVFFASIFFCCVACNTPKTAQGENPYEKGEMTILLADKSSPKELVEDWPQLTIKGKTSRSQNQWLFSYSVSKKTSPAFLSEIENSIHVIEVIKSKKN